MRLLVEVVLLVVILLVGVVGRMVLALRVARFSLRARRASLLFLRWCWLWLWVL
jgi:hypothetical protein